MFLKCRAGGWEKGVCTQGGEKGSGKGGRAQACITQAHLEATGDWQEGAPGAPEGGAAFGLSWQGACRRGVEENKGANRSCWVRECVKGLPGPAKSQAQPQLPSIATLLGFLLPKQQPSPIPCLPPLPPAQPDQAGSQGLPWDFVIFLYSNEFFWEFPAGDVLPQCPQTGCGNGLGLSTSSGLHPTWEPQGTHPNHSFPIVDPKATRVRIPGRTFCCLKAPPLKTHRSPSPCSRLSSLTPESKTRPLAGSTLSL